MLDIYLYDDAPVLKNKLDIKDSDTLDGVEAGMSRASMMLLYESGFHDFSPAGLKEIHRRLFEDVYEWAGQYRIINIEKRERLLAASAGYVRDAFVMASMEQFSEFEHLEKILLDAVRDEPITYTDLDAPETQEHTEKYAKYYKEGYKPEPHYAVDKDKKQ